MEKKVLAEISLYYGKVSTPKGFEINWSELAHHILHSKIHNQTFLFSKEWDALNIYCREHLQLKYNLKLVNKKLKVKYKKSSCPVAEKLLDKKYLGILLCSYSYSEKDARDIVKAFKKVWEQIDQLK